MMERQTKCYQEEIQYQALEATKAAIFLCENTCVILYNKILFKNLIIH